MKRTGLRESAQALVLLLIVLFVLAAGTWWLFSGRAKNEAATRAFAQQAAERIALQLDRKFLDTHIARGSQTRYPPSFRDRMVDHLREFGSATGPVDLTGTVTFDSYFFDPHGRFEARIPYPETTGIFVFGVSRAQGWWQLDYLDLRWKLPPPPPTPMPTPGALEPSTPGPEKSPKPAR